MSSIRGHEFFDALDGLNATTRTHCGTVQRGSGTGKIKLTWQPPALQKPIDKSSVKDVAGASGVHSLHAKSWRVMELRAIPREDPLLSQSRSRKATPILTPKYRQRFAQILFAHQSAGNITAGDQVIDIL